MLVDLHSRDSMAFWEWDCTPSYDVLVPLPISLALGSLGPAAMRHPASGAGSPQRHWRNALAHELSPSTQAAGNDAQTLSELLHSGIRK